MDDQRSGPAGPAEQTSQWRLRAVTDDDLDYLQACAEAEHSALDLIDEARHEAAEQGQLALHHARLAMEHAARQLELLQLADRAERVVKNSSQAFIPRHQPPTLSD